ncbi:MAG: hypothetical protein P1U63_02350 [Coxiellaceae bacterium]|nr:hypothetical protein [Coxiellaceae bacterium]
MRNEEFVALVEKFKSIRNKGRQFWRFNKALNLSELSRDQLNTLFETRSRDGSTCIGNLAQREPTSLRNILSKHSSTDDKFAWLQLKDSDGRTALMHLLDHCSFTFRVLLEDLSPDQKTQLLSIKNNNGWTDLMVAAYYHPKKVAAILTDLTYVQQQYLFSIKNNMGDTALDLLADKGNQANCLYAMVRDATVSLSGIRGLLKNSSVELHDCLNDLLQSYIHFQMLEWEFAGPKRKEKLSNKIKGAMVLLESIKECDLPEFISVASQQMWDELTEDRWHGGQGTLSMMLDLFTRKYPNCEIRHAWKDNDRLAEVAETKEKKEAEQLSPVSVSCTPCDEPPPSYDEIEGWGVVEMKQMRATPSAPPESELRTVTAKSLTGVTKRHKTGFMRKAGKPCFERTVIGQPVREAKVLTIEQFNQIKQKEKINRNSSAHYIEMTVFDSHQMPQAPTGPLVGMGEQGEGVAVKI